jgi:hypothetical protein
MRTLTITAIILVAFAAFGQTTSAKLSFFLGEVETRVGDGEWKAAQLNVELSEGDAVHTGSESRAELTLPDGSVVRVDENSELAVSELAGGADDQKAGAALGFGRMWARVRGVMGAGSFTAETPTAVAAIRGTVFRVDFGADSTFALRVYEGVLEVKPVTARPGEQGMGTLGPPEEVGGPGEVPGPHEVTMEEWTEIVRQYQVCSYRPGAPPTVEDFDPEEDRLLEWVQWNMSRDAALGW